MKRVTTALIAAASIAALTACVPEEGTPTPAPTTWSYTPPKFVAPTTVIPVKTDPYTTTGTWLVPAEIAPGTYRVKVRSGSSTGYTAVCADYTCDPGPGMISNENHKAGPGSDILVIPADAVSVQLKRVALTPMAGA